MSKVLVMMSGGVDSSVAAYLLKQQGHDVTGVTMRLFDPKDLLEPASPGLGPAGPSCCGGKKDACLAQDCAMLLGIKHEILDEKQRFREDIIDAFKGAYMAGETPNPCVDCNRFLKFGTILVWAQERGVDAVATGHYAKVAASGPDTGLFKAKDAKKDQSYFLYMLDERQLPRVMFPLGDMTKEEVRALAAQVGLPTAAKPESQDICFVGALGGDYRTMLGPALEGPIVERTTGKVLGRHTGHFNYTIGQREGLGIAVGEPLYVTSVDAAKNTVFVGKDGDLVRTEVSLRDVTWTSRRHCEMTVVEAGVKIRYRSPEVAATIHTAQARRARVVFTAAVRAPAPGQSAVFYDGDRVLGGGIICG
ncbi:MAG: tRNA 2-thiouridine(34) synthase MnmA [Elusimicrobiota bacterium]